MIFLQSLWGKYILKDLIKMFSFFLCAFFFLYCVIDYATHAQDFHRKEHFDLIQLFSYYSCQFIKRSNLLLPLALLISSTKVLCSLNSSRELVALQASGLKLKTILRPFLFLGFVCSLFNWYSMETLYPLALNSLEAFDNQRHENRDRKKVPFHVLHLSDHSKLVYQRHDKTTNQFCDVYWIRSFNDIWRIKTLNADPKKPIASFADHLVRNKDGSITKAESYERCLLNELIWADTHLTRKGMTPIENRRLSGLIKEAIGKGVVSKKEKNEVLSYLFYKALMPSLSLIVVIAIAPFCTSYSRSIPVFYIYSGALFGIIAFFTLMDSSIILGIHGALPPLIALLVPFGLCSTLFTLKFAKTY